MTELSVRRQPQLYTNIFRKDNETQLVVLEKTVDDRRLLLNSENT